MVESSKDDGVVSRSLKGEAPGHEESSLGAARDTAHNDRRNSRKNAMKALPGKQTDLAGLGGAYNTHEIA